MKKSSVIIIILFILFRNISFAQHTISLSGFVTDKISGEVLINATIANTKKFTGVMANNYGFYTMKIEADEDVFITCSYVGYQSQQMVINLSKDTTINFKLEKEAEIDEVVIKAGNSNLYKIQPVTGIIEMKADMARKLPTLLGEADLTRMLQLKPGVQNGNEGSGGLFVRGGTTDQNLILLDGMPVYNPGHLGGFISIFNPSSVNYIKLYKGGFPARFGGRLSSILDVRMKNGNLKHSESFVSVGTITTSFSWETPIRKDTSSIIIAGRRTLFDLFVSGYNYLDTNGKYNGGYNLWDLNLKYNKKIDDKTRIYLSFYKGKDKIFSTWNDKYSHNDTVSNYKGKYKLSWGNTMASYRINKVYSGKVFADYTIGVSDYRYGITNDYKVKKEKILVNHDYTSFVSSITDFIFSPDYEFLINNKHSLQFGLQGVIHYFSPCENKIEQTIKEVVYKDSIWGAKKITVPEMAVYGSDVFTITPKLSTEIGIRYVVFFLKDKPVQKLEPRIVGNFQLNNNISIKGSYSAMSQFTHLISASDQSLPSDFWLPSTGKIPPERSMQLSIGTFWTFNLKQDFEFSFDSYYKKMDDLVEIKGGTSFIKSGADWENQIYSNGKGKVWGAEFMLEKKTGKTTGWIAYTLSKNVRKFDEINKGNWLPFKYDRRHQISIVVCHEFNDHINLSANWIFMTGAPATLAKYKYLINTQEFYQGNIGDGTYDEVYDYQGRNSFRTPAYHRLDLNINFIKKFDDQTRTWSVGLYNAYNHYNSYYLYFGKNKNGETKLFSLTLFPIMPSISYSYKF
jgi:hypothetical protein